MPGRGNISGFSFFSPLLFEIRGSLGVAAMMLSNGSDSLFFHVGLVFLSGCFPRGLREKWIQDDASSGAL